MSHNVNEEAEGFVVEKLFQRNNLELERQLKFNRRFRAWPAYERDSDESMNLTELRVPIRQH